MSKPGAGPASGISLGDAWYSPSGIRHVGGANLNRALVRNVSSVRRTGEGDDHVI